METLKSIKRMNKAILLLAMGINYIHQALFFWTLGAWLLALLLPLGIDMMILLCVKITQTTGVARTSKRNAMIVLIPFVLLSAVISFMAPGHILLRVIFAAIVIEIGLAEWLLASFRIDQPAMDKAAGKAKRVRSPESIRRGVETAAANRAKKEETARKRRETIERKRIDKELAEMVSGKVVDSMPISPIPYL